MSDSKILQFTNSPDKRFDAFMRAFDDGDYFSACSLLNGMMLEERTVILLEWQAILHFKMIGSESVLDYNARLMVSGNSEIESIGGSFMISWWLKQNKDKLALWYLDFMSARIGARNEKNTKDLLDAIAAYRRTAFYNGFSVLDKEHLNKVYLEKSKIFLEKGMSGEAVELLKNIDEESSLYDQALDLISYGQIGIKDIETAEDNAKKSLEKNPNSIQAITNLAKIQRLKKDKKYETTLAKIQEISVDSVSDYVTLTRFYLQIQDYNRAKYWLERALESLPYSNQLLRLLGVCNYNLCDYNSAKNALFKCFTINPREVFARELFLMLEEKDTKKLPKEISIENGVPHAIIKRAAMQIDSIINMPDELFSSVEMQTLSNALNWVIELNETNSVVAVLLIRKCLTSKAGQMAVRDVLFSFQTPDYIKKIAITEFVKLGRNISRLWFVAEDKICYANIHHPKGLYDEFNINQNKKWALKNAPFDFGVLAQSYAEAYAFIAFSTETGYESRLKAVCERVLKGMDSFPSNLKKLINVDVIVASLVLLVHSDKYLDGEISVPALSHKEFSNLSLVTGHFEVERSAVETFIKNI